MRRLAAATAVTIPVEHIVVGIDKELRAQGRPERAEREKRAAGDDGGAAAAVH